MRIKHIRLTNFRNYSTASIKLTSGKNIFIGENAQGKTNFLEAIEMASVGHSSRATRDNELIRWGQDNFRIHIEYEKGGDEETVALALNAVSTPIGGVKLEKSVKINGVLRNSFRTLLGKIVTVSFSSQDLNLLRGGPKFRREWVDSVVLRAKPSYQTILANYAKVVAQRNRFLKELAEKGRVTVQDQDALSAWDQQLVRYGVPMIMQRLKLLNELMPLAKKYLLQISGQADSLDAKYIFHDGQSRSASFGQEEDYDTESEGDADETADSLSADSLSTDQGAMNETELADILLNLLKRRRTIDMLRRHTLTGPHRDDIAFMVNKSSATMFASQGQQRSLVLALKLAELDYITTSIEETPILLLDDVLAELDLGRQAALMAALPASMQTVITTTHVAGFDPRWLQDASIYTVQQGAITIDSPNCLEVHQ
jgi:DNA replication and repair protein RecF